MSLADCTRLAKGVSGVSLLSLQSRCAHAGRWRARLDSVEALPPARPSGFVAARVGATAARSFEAPSVRVDIGAGGGRVELHWPLAHIDRDDYHGEWNYVI